MTVEQLKQIAAVGGGLVIDATTLTFKQIAEISVVAKTGNARIKLKNPSSLTAGQLAAIAALAPGLIVFDLTS
jgi:hypothetical protein